MRGRLKVFEGVCPHQGALLGEGEIEGNHLVCRNHRWKFDRETGQRVGGRQCLEACPTEDSEVTELSAFTMMPVNLHVRLRRRKDVRP